MSWCNCCRAEIRESRIRTKAGDFVIGWGLCRSCWRLVGVDRRAVLRRARLEYRDLPFFSQAVLLQRAWSAVLMQAIERRACRRAA